jgi:hypothetical protein
MQNIDENSGNIMILTCSNGVKRDRMSGPKGAADGTLWDVHDGTRNKKLK